MRSNALRTCSGVGCRYLCEVRLCREPTSDQEETGDYVDRQISALSHWFSPSHLSVFLEHYFGGLDYDLNGITLLERHFLDTSPRDHAFDEVLPNAYDDVGHHSAKLNLLDGSFELIRAERVMSVA